MCADCQMILLCLLLAVCRRLHFPLHSHLWLSFNLFIDKSNWQIRGSRWCTLLPRFHAARAVTKVGLYHVASRERNLTLRRNLHCKLRRKWHSLNQLLLKSCSHFKESKAWPIRSQSLKSFIHGKLPVLYTEDSVPLFQSLTINWKMNT